MPRRRETSNYHGRVCCWRTGRVTSRQCRSFDPMAGGRQSRRWVEVGCTELAARPRVLARGGENCGCASFSGGRSSKVLALLRSWHSSAIGIALRHVPQDDLRWEGADASHFTGLVEVARLSAADADAATSVAVRFAPAARTDWHSHAAGQLLWIMVGSAIVTTEDGRRIVASAGDVVIAPPGELHWHGATGDGPMMHVSVTADGGALWTSRKVDDDEYRERRL